MNILYIKHRLHTGIKFAALPVMFGLLLQACSSKNKDANLDPYFYPTDMLFEDLPLERFSHVVPDVPLTTGPATFSIKKENGDWSGFALSNHNFRGWVTTDASLDSTRFSAYSATGPSATGNFLVVRPRGDDARVTFNRPLTVDKLLITPSTFLWQAMMYAQGTSLSGVAVKSFAYGTRVLSTARKDYVKVIISGYNGEVHTGDVEILLADRYSNDNNKRSFTVNDWLPVSLTSLGAVTGLVFRFDSSDRTTTGEINTPAFFCIDGIRFTEAVY